jgi:hypothetical protein
LSLPEEWVVLLVLPELSLVKVPDLRQEMESVLQWDLELEMELLPARALVVR